MRALVRLGLAMVGEIGGVRLRPGLEDVATNMLTVKQAGVANSVGVKRSRCRAATRRLLPGYTRSRPCLAMHPNAPGRQFSFKPQREAGPSKSGREAPLYCANRANRRECKNGETANVKRYAGRIEHRRCLSYSAPRARGFAAIPEN
jgi:hypothetical protein